MKNELLLSICIPTYNRPYLIRDLLNSVISKKVDPKYYEICISDDSTNDDTKKIVNEFLDMNNNINIVYRHIEPLDSYMNLLNSLKMGKGKYLKLVSDYCYFLENTLSDMIEMIKKYNVSKPLIFWLDKSEDDFGVVESFCDLNDFIVNNKIMITWAKCFGIWKQDFDKAILNAEIDSMFPHLSLLLEVGKDKTSYLNIPKKIFDSKDLNVKGGYSIPKVFGNGLYSILIKLKDENIITKKTLLIFKVDIIKFLAYWKAVCKKKKNFFYDYSDDYRIVFEQFGLLWCMCYCIFFWGYNFKGDL